MLVVLRDLVALIEAAPVELAVLVKDEYDMPSEVLALVVVLAQTADVSVEIACVISGRLILRKLADEVVVVTGTRAVAFEIRELAAEVAFDTARVFCTTLEELETVGDNAEDTSFWASTTKFEAELRSEPSSSRGKARAETGASA